MKIIDAAEWGWEWLRAILALENLNDALDVRHHISAGWSMKLPRTSTLIRSPRGSLESTPLCAKSRLFRSRVDRFERGTNREEIMKRTDSRRESDEKGRKEVHETRDRKANESMAWKTWLYLAAPWKRRITLRGRVPLCLETTRPAYSWEYLLLRAGYEVTIAGTPSSWNRFYCRLVKRGIRPVLRRFYSNDVERRGWIGDLVDI